MDYVVDVQGFKSYNNEFIYKEIAVIALQEDAIPSVYFFQPPFAWKYLPTKCKSVNRWLEINYLGIPWNAGDIPYEEVTNTLRSVLQDAKTIYVKGMEKKRWLERIVSNVSNIEEHGCPPLKELQKTTLALCSHHRLCWKPACAVQNVYALKSWMLERRRQVAVSKDEVDEADINYLSMYN